MARVRQKGQWLQPTRQRGCNGAQPASSRHAGTADSAEAAHRRHVSMRDDKSERAGDGGVRERRNGRKGRSLKGQIVKPLVPGSVVLAQPVSDSDSATISPVSPAVSAVRSHLPNIVIGHPIWPNQAIARPNLQGNPI